ncbi:dethiobiotin synthase [Bacillus sp. DNRA2]|uniref:dethiobiotin synthase n=1 Tax=Bacillus sp. DNRA2 TaxID=2723053 RepID=UPI00145CAF12|nr:dethiobiotin synthase [Bacillus sp. DNRA2]NMD71462.1 dethiobiotin synthase [Bacillus sp. DNRA2]
MTQHFWVVGTDTDVGKTLVTAAMMEFFQRKGENVIPYKPVQSGIVIEGSKSYYPDTAFYQAHSNTRLVEEHVNSYSFKEPASPHYAAFLDGAMISKDVILNHINHLKMQYDYVICEGAGGLFVPLDEQLNYCFIDLIQESQLPVVLVTRTTLGTINHTLLSLEALKNRDIAVAGIVFNGFHGTHLEINNVRAIQQLTSLPSLTIPKLSHVASLGGILLDGPLIERLMKQ